MIKKNDNFFLKINNYFYKMHLIDYYFIYLAEQMDFLILFATNLESLIFYKKISLNPDDLCFCFQNQFLIIK